MIMDYKVTIRDEADGFETVMTYSYDYEASQPPVGLIKKDYELRHAVRAKVESEIGTVSGLKVIRIEEGSVWV